MMDDLKIDERNIAELTYKVAELMKDMMRDIETLDDKEEDVFLRYMSLVRLGAIFTAAKQAEHMARHVFRMGFEMHHEYFQTKKAKENGWDEITEIQENPFFKRNDVKVMSVDLNELPDDIKQAIHEALERKRDKAH
jgi:hypothetical protein